MCSAEHKHTQIHSQSYMPSASIHQFSMIRRALSHRATALPSPIAWIDLAIQTNSGWNFGGVWTLHSHNATAWCICVRALVVRCPIYCGVDSRFFPLFFGRASGGSSPSSLVLVAHNGSVLLRGACRINGRSAVGGVTMNFVSLTACCVGVRVCLPHHIEVECSQSVECSFLFVYGNEKMTWSYCLLRHRLSIFYFRARFRSIEQYDMQF